MTKQEFKQMVSDRIVILDGATGTLLQQMGMPAGVCPEKWALENPEALINIQRQYIQSGSDIIYAFTFGANELKLKEFGIDDVTGINRELVRISKQASQGRVLVAGDMSPTGQLMEPFGSYSFEEIVNAYKKQVIGLLEGGVDLFVIETMMDIQEARAALLAVKETCNLPVIVTMTFERGGYTINGTDPLTALVTLQSLGADAVGCNCSTGPEEMLGIIKKLRPYADVPLVAKANAGMPRLVDGKTVFSMNADEFAAFTEKFIEAGVNLIGGCCGTTPEYIQKISKIAKGRKGSECGCKNKNLIISSSCTTVSVGHDLPVCIIGERINPTGKKKLSEELRKGSMDLVVELARDQSELGAQVLDVNAGLPDIDERETLTKIVKTLSPIVKTPLCLDSSSPEALEATLRIYPGRALINSISAEKRKLERILPIAAKYGAAFILLPVDDVGVPETAEDRIRIVENVYEKAAEYGYTKSDILVDGLVLTVAANQKSCLETLKVIKWSTEEFGANTVIGLSNVSFGLPGRSWINAAFLAMAISHGLSAVIMNVQSEETMHVKRAADALTGRDCNSMNFIKTYQKQDIPKEERKNKGGIYDCVVEGRRGEVVELIKSEIAAGMHPAKIVDEYLVPAITRVGELYQERIYFLPQLIQSAETMEAAMNYILPLLEENSVQVKKKGKIVIATVKGDIHDIGKNMVALMLRNYGFDVVDLGKDVDSEIIIKTAVEEKADIIGLSALMTTTMQEMRVVAEKIRERNINVGLMIGGAPVNEDYAREIGAVYAKDAYAAVKKAESMVAGK
ncbi:5-methyltetrahydrofolate--homocysteine methyltransferase [Thermoclostridium stercorarium subsp. leptospartum DSM 9219]|uniref:Methionine synthase n=1 Tax=Thermoclostridium stercorarium subsp. leptospartum DSM 9219 TaxID=1346611 RepID=A0A1B1YNY5_THEST|nr:homocysteine S-methyltransferase family protein [Thermoclostridium stercorarium]ANX02493.1 5-methyltetrahydrofolate--homocysteine methyltransferase [Thermoclostridium stercorarium subsp. leptospartum DSM 9219]